MQNLPEVPFDSAAKVLAFFAAALIAAIVWLFSKYEKRIKEKDKLIHAITKEHLLDIKQGKEETIKANTETIAALEKQNLLLEQIKDIVTNEKRS